MAEYMHLADKILDAFEAEGLPRRGEGCLEAFEYSLAILAIHVVRQNDPRYGRCPAESPSQCIVAVHILLAFMYVDDTITTEESVSGAHARHDAADDRALIATGTQDVSSLKAIARARL